VLVERRDRVVEDHVDGVAEQVRHRGGQRAAGDLDVPARDAATDRLGPDRAHLTAVVVVEGEPAGVDVREPEPVGDPHPVGHLQRSTADVDRVAATAEGRRSFHDRHPESVPVQPVGQGRPGDAGTGDQDCGCVRCCHRRALLR
jgi:hypothetical protein